MEVLTRSRGSSIVDIVLFAKNLMKLTKICLRESAQLKHEGKQEIPAGSMCL